MKRVTTTTILAGAEFRNGFSSTTPYPSEKSDESAWERDCGDDDENVRRRFLIPITMEITKKKSEKEEAVSRKREREEKKLGRMPAMEAN